jgi:hypothetical protein
MRFVLVNARAPRREPFCVSCYEPIRTGYLRELGTHLIYCNPDCYQDHCESAFLALEIKARGSRTAPALGPAKRRCDESR